MGSNYLTSPLMLIINTLFDFYILLVLLRFIFQSFRADFYNPVSQFIVKATTPPLHLLRRIIPSVAGQDMAAIVFCLILIYAKFILLRVLDVPVVAIGNVNAPIGAVSYLGLSIYALADLVALTFTIFTVVIIIQVVLSWISPGQYNPIIGLVNSIASRILRPFKKLLPPMGGLDLSPLLAMLAIMVLKMLIIPPIIMLGSF